MRGEVDHGWLKAKHSFNFGSYYDPDRMGFGLLKVLNDDWIDPSKGFGTHAHSDMEIVSIPLQGALKHKDNFGNEAVIEYGEVQLMSAGSGVEHSEFNDSDQEKVNLLQIWVMPEKVGIKPRYDQKRFLKEDRKNKIQTIVSPIGDTEGGVKINQQAYFSMVDLDKDKRVQYSLKKPGHGVYLFVIDGEVTFENEELSTRDAVGVSGKVKLDLLATKDSKLLFIEIPMS